MKLSSGFYALLLLVTTSAQANKMIYADVQVSELAPTAEAAIWQRSDNTTPLYPIVLAKNGISGCGIFKVQIQQDGEVDKVSLVQSVPARVLSKAGIKTIKSWKWQNSSGKAAAAEEKLIRLDFCIGGASVAEAEQRCKLQASLACESNAG
ncbi:energy transducer TonB [Rheinheimera sp. 4Y26]|uniref:energy transducer TonB n=1 Tax=Rheinheimera sp. 4Y26 TaxID=2977811 RepID=UPI0021B0E448|nr:energy transducer TonB [Rheinheimera sp. 4Y26]MCT6700000.1 energy transducer TonB [Rheinheimera sp. 4Y26]